MHKAIDLKKYGNVAIKGILNSNWLIIKQYRFFLTTMGRFKETVGCLPGK